MKRDFIHFIITLAITVSIGLLSGYTLGFYSAKTSDTPKIQMVNDVNAGIATIKLYKVSSGKLIGKLVGKKARIVYNANGVLELKKGDEFEIPLNQVLLSNYYSADTIPKNTLFIASRKGKYFYSIFDKRSLNISKKNRLYFGSKVEAINMGYKKK